MFAGIAQSYDLLNHLLSLNFDKRWRRTCIANTPVEPGKEILDVCTGTGDLALGYFQAAQKLAKQGSAPIAITGSDFCAEMLDRARLKGERQKADIEWVEADAMQLPFADSRFHLVTVAFGLRNIADTRRGLEEMIRVLEPGGTLAILEFSRPRVPVLSTLYLTFFKHVLPRVGQWVSASKDDAYHYLPASVLEFPDGEDMAGLLREVGLEAVSYKPLTIGIATLYLGKKPANSAS